MSEDIKPEVIKRTQDSLKKFVKKPPLTEKLLKKPPFRFLHDLISSIMKETGFLQGLYTAEEMISENIKDRDAKVAYLEKLILAVKLATGANLTARPTKIVAGLEVDRTNELLQAIGKALEKKIDSRSAVEQVINKGTKKATGSNKSQNKATSKNKQTKEQANEESKPEKPKKSPTKSNKEATLKPSKESKKTKKNESSNVIPKKRERKDSESPARKAETSPVKSKSILRNATIKETNEKQSSFDSVKSKEGEKSNNAPESPTTNEPTKERRNSNADVSKAEENAKIQKAADNVDDKNGPNSIEAEQSMSSLVENSPSKAVVNEKEESKGNAIKEAEGRPESRRPGSAHPGHRRTDSFAKGASIDSQADDQSESTSVVIHNKAQAKAEPSTSSNEKEKNALVKQVTVFGGSSSRQSTAKVMNAPVARPRTATRPPSARPGAPRVRDRGHVQVAEEVSRSPSAVVNVIVDSGTNNEDDIDEGSMVVVEPQQSIISSDVSEEQVGEVKSEDNVNFQNEEQGQLVAQILETQRELEISGPSSSKTEIDWEGGRKRERESTLKEVERLRTAIQTLTRAANPLGKLIDFLQEDVDSMQREYSNWREAYAKSMADLQNEQSLTDASLEPLKLQLGELELLIQDELDTICAVKANILRNDEKIQRFLSGSKS